MNKLCNVTILLCLLCAMPSVALAQGKLGEARGELLYMAHCNTCHTTQIHWREQKLVWDRESLEAQVRRWQGISGLNWTEGEISDVAHYLNTQFYEYKNTAQGQKPIRLMHKD